MSGAKLPIIQADRIAVLHDYINCHSVDLNHYTTVVDPFRDSAIEEHLVPDDPSADLKLLLESGLCFLFDYFHHVKILRVIWGNCQHLEDCHLWLGGFTDQAEDLLDEAHTGSVHVRVLVRDDVHEEHLDALRYGDVLRCEDLRCGKDCCLVKAVIHHVKILRVIWGKGTDLC